MSDDKFEQSEMHDGAPIVHRDKKVSRKMAGMLSLGGLLPLLVGLLIVINNPGSPKPLPTGGVILSAGLAAVMGISYILMAIAMGVLRTVVTEKAVHVKYGLMGPTIPLEAIKSCKVIDYKWTEFGGWGIRIGRNNSRAYVTSNGPVVEIVYEDKGKDRRVVIGAENAAATALAINQTREAKVAHVRIANESSSNVDAEVDALAEAEVEADQKLSARR